MKKKILWIMLAIVIMIGQVQAQSTRLVKDVSPDSLSYQITFYFRFDSSDWMQKGNDVKMDTLLQLVKSDSVSMIKIDGWADSRGVNSVNQRLSERRANSIKDYLVRQGIQSQRIFVEGHGVDYKALNYDVARRADVHGVICLYTKSEPNDTQAIVEPQPQPQLQQDSLSLTEVKKQPKQSESDVIKPKKSALRWYVGVEGGVLFGVSTLSSFANSKTYIDWVAGVYGGYRLSPLLSVEVGASIGEIKLGASQCCEDYWLGVNGVRYLEHVAGMDTYSYRDIYSKVSMQQYALRLNVDLLQIANPDLKKRWSLTLSPSVYGVNTKTTVFQCITNSSIIKRDSQFQFGAGATIGASYYITKNFGIGLRSSGVWVIGNRFDGITLTDHNDNLIWSNTIALTWRFGR